MRIGSVLVLAGAIGCGWACSSSAVVQPAMQSGAGGSTHAAGSVASSSGEGQVSSAGAGGTVGSGGAGAAGGSGGSGGCPSPGFTCQGVCVDLQNDPFNCGACGTLCAAPHALTTCSSEECTIEHCDMGWADCNGIPSDGCETAVGTDPMNCGACGAACVVPHATPSCTQGTCTIGACDSGWTDCNASPTDGCETMLWNDPNNCGQCGTQCPAQYDCVQGQCDQQCAWGWITCVAKCDTKVSNQNCGHCGTVCALPNAVSHCMAFDPGSPYTCNILSCNAGYADCNALSSDGCEVDTNTDANNCGTCGNACPAGHACVAGVCQ